MEIYGIQKLTLLDFPGRIATTIFLSGCNLRCPYCHNRDVALNKKYAHCNYPNSSELIQLLIARKPLIKNVVISGGEPLAQPDVLSFIKEIKSCGLSVKIDTNGCYPTVLEEILSHNLVDYVAMDIKNSLSKYEQTVGTKDFNIEAVKESAKLLRAGTTQYEFRTTLVSEFHSAADIIKIGQWLNGSSSYYLQNYVDSDNIADSNFHALLPSEVKKFQLIASQFFEKVSLRNI